ncbi:MAG TPA: hemerythrin domain-containing protein [Pseudonocardiaceae bacterium]|nr:hemerythrin domain-containing protein [Pseudonocardiaceae bacterium]
MTAQTAELDAAQDVVEFLIGQHMQIRDLFTEVETSTGQARRDAFERLVTLLAVHETAEDQLIHPLVRTGVDGGGDIVDDRLAEERAAKEMLARLEDLGPDAAEFPSLLAELRVSVLTHAHNEEAYEFRYLRREVAAAQLQPLVDMVRAAEAVAPTHPHPGVESATANTVAGPVVSLFDRTKDMVRRAMSGSR